ncbi:hypothetical protein H9P43_003334 [Blastocladiella emersonii ATCC 22665]|nr:hypothetical protein H9P43_003334 [Blastocladiella emersonii ATCC 22665]
MPSANANGISAAMGTGARLPTRSVLGLEIDLREKLSRAPDAPNESRVRACFEVLATVPSFAPTLGPMMDTIRQELETAIFSNQLTLSPHISSAVDKVTSLDKIPWFVLVTRLGDMRKEELTESRETLADLQHKVKVRERDISLLQKRIIASKQEILNREDSIAELKETISKLERRLGEKDMEMDELNKAYQMKLDLAARERETVELSLAQANNTIERLSVFKTSKDSNDDQLSARIWVTEKRELMVPDPMRVTEISIKETETLQRQLFDIMNNHIDDLESSLLQIRKKREILGNSGREEDDIEQQHLMREFETSMVQLENELALLTDHKRSLQAALARYRETAEYIEWARFAHETQRKYALALLVSTDGGRSFRPEKRVPYCSRCAERVLVCPHMPSPGVLDYYDARVAAGQGYSWTVQLPAGTTHVQFRRPNLTIPIPTKVLLNDSFAINDDEHEDFVEMRIHRASRYFKVIWHYIFNKRGLRRPVLPRVFTMDRLTRLISDLYDARWNYELDSTDHTSSFIEFFYDFIIGRYHVVAVANRVVYEVLAALEHHQETNTNIQLFVRHLAGSDSCVWKYFRHVAHYISLNEPLDSPKYRKIIHALYPCRSDALYEQLELEQQAYHGAGTKIHGESVREQIKTMLRRRMEPNVRGFTRLLARYDLHAVGFLTQARFIEALNEILPGVQRELAVQHYVISEHDYGAGRVGVDRAGQIMAYLYVHQCTVAGWGFSSLAPAGATAATGGSNGGDPSNGSLPSLAPGRPNNIVVGNSMSSMLSLTGEPAAAGGKAAGMPIMRHLQDELMANSKLEPDDLDENDVRRIERVLQAVDSIGYVASGHLSGSGTGGGGGDAARDDGGADTSRPTSPAVPPPAAAAAPPSSEAAAAASPKAAPSRRVSTKPKSP